MNGGSRRKVARRPALTEDYFRSGEAVLHAFPGSGKRVEIAVLILGSCKTVSAAMRRVVIHAQPLPLDVPGGLGRVHIQWRGGACLELWWRRRVVEVCVATPW